MVNACAFSCPKSPTLCKSKCLLNQQYFIPSTLANIAVSYLISCLFVKEKNNS